MKERPRWTTEEDKILVQAIKANPQNKEEAFKKAAKKLNRTKAACSNRWYQTLSNPYNKKYVGCAFTLIGHRNRLNNRTQYIPTKDNQLYKPEKVKTSLWSKIKELLNLK